MVILAGTMPKTATPEEFEADLLAFKQMLKDLGMSQTSLAEKLGMHPKSIHNAISTAKRTGTPFPYREMIFIYRAARELCDEK